MRAAVRMRLLTVRSIEDLIPATAGTRRAVELRAERQTLTAKVDEARALYNDGVLDAASLRLRVADLTEKIRVLDDALDAVERQNAFARLLADGAVGLAKGSELDHWFESKSLDHKRQIILTLYPRIVLLPAPRVRAPDQHGRTAPAVYTPGGRVHRSAAARRRRVRRRLSPVRHRLSPVMRPPYEPLGAPLASLGVGSAPGAHTGYRGAPGAYEGLFSLSDWFRSGSTPG